MAATAEPVEYNNHLALALKSGKYSDLEIRCQDLVLKVHRVIVCTGSKPMAAMIDNNFLEATTGVINLPDDDPEIIWRMVLFLYASTYSVLPKEETYISESTMGKAECTSEASLLLEKYDGADPEALIIHVKMYVIGDKYGILPLKTYAANRYSFIAAHHWATPDFAQSIIILYENTISIDMELKLVIMNVVNRYRRILHTSDFAETCLQGCPDFCLDMLQYMAIN